MDRNNLCRHCGLRKRCRPRGLCWACYYDKAITVLYPSTSKFGRWSLIADTRSTRPLPPQPCVARPGSPEKIAVLEERAMLRVQLWHPMDRGA
jgi:hypothetical protein